MTEKEPAKKEKKRAKLDYEYTKEDYAAMSSVPFEQKINIALARILEVVETVGAEKCAVSFSGGKDSVVLLDLCHRVAPDMKATYFDTGMEHPYITEFVSTFPNVETVKPQYCKTCVNCKLGCFGRVSAEKGFVYPNKRARSAIRIKPETLANIKNDECRERYHDLRAQLHDIQAELGIKISDVCCIVLKKNTAKRWAKENCIKMQFVGVKANESENRMHAWYLHGCTWYGGGKSNPLSLWKEQDILRYIKQFNLPYCEKVYGELQEIESGRNKGRLRFSKAQRTGCVGCPISFNSSAGLEELADVRENFPELYSRLEAVPGWAELLQYALGRQEYKEASKQCERVRKNFGCEQIDLRSFCEKPIDFFSESG